MNKNYNNMLMIAMLSLATHNGLMPAEQPKNICADPNKHPLRAAIKNYIMTYAVFSSGVPVISAGAIAALGSAPLRMSMKEFKKLNYQLGKGLLKTIPVTASVAVGYNAAQKHYIE